MKKKLRVALTVVFCLFLLIEGIGMYLSNRTVETTDSNNGKKPSLKALRAKNKLFRQKLDGLSIKGIHLIVDTAKNVLYLKSNEKAVMEAVVSCGSGSILEDPSGKRTWIFDTPRGVYSVKSKAKNPVWIKPDWAFVEEGEAIPPTNAKERIEEGVLGDYALGIGGGYFIHGTLYTRLLGRNVTHGCIRVGDKDLDRVFRAADLGTKVVIF